MISGFIVKKINMTNLYQEGGRRLAVTKLLASPLIVTQVKTKDTDKYESVQIAYGSRKRLSQPVAKKLSGLKLDITPQSFKEFKINSENIPKIGDSISFDAVFQIGDEINATAKSKGHGFAGVIKRWGFQRQPVTGGQSDRVRAPGAIGAQTPGKVIKGKKMPGHYGNAIKTVTHLKVIAYDKDKSEVLVSGSVPGARNSWVVLSK
jgi:large subunit ribosomal protein L3